MLYREIMVVCSEIHTKHINTLCVCVCVCVCSCLWLSASGRLCVKLNQMVHIATTLGLHAFLRKAVDEGQCLPCLASRSYRITEVLCVPVWVPACVPVWVPVQMWVCHTVETSPLFSDTDARCRPAAYHWQFVRNTVCSYCVVSCHHSDRSNPDECVTFCP